MCTGPNPDVVVAIVGHGAGRPDRPVHLVGPHIGALDRLCGPCNGGIDVAFVDKGSGRIEPRDLKLAGQFGDTYAVESGLSEGERVIASANFLIDSEAKVQGALADFHEH